MPMIKNFTLNHVLLYVYNELNSSQTKHIKQQLLVDTLLYRQAAEFLFLKNKLSTIYFEPSETHDKNILAHAKKSAKL